MDQQIRNLLQNATQRARRLLEIDITEQLGGTFDILEDGTVAENPGPHLSPEQKLVRQKLVESVRHRAGGSTQKDKLAEAVSDYKREAAFTILNRFVALKMLEARGLLQQCISKGDQSSGFKEFCLLAPGLAALSDKGYRLYLECLFDELSVEVKILFDRHDPASLIWPKRQTFDDLLTILNEADLASIWGVDETIGWVYQYFNSQEERRAMREASQTPRNSRELAVRNQFFTPRYVVQFMTDNTLGRVWYEMRKGQTRLVEQCEYMVRRLTEIFLNVGEAAPETPKDRADLSQEELIRQPVHIPHRPRKDPRDLKILDPASGSGHFLLYCFDLLLTIYEEAWKDADSPASLVTGKTLRQDYSTEAALREAIPGLILRHNLHGIDIDPRCAQIAALALWMRAQRAFSDFKLTRDARPLIRKTNIVVAEPMPGEPDLFEEFLRELKEDRLESLIHLALNVPADKQVRATKAMADSLCELVHTVWGKMKLAGELGSLLKIEEELTTAVAKGRSEWEERLPLFRVTQYDLDGSSSTRIVRTVPGGENDFWSRAEMLVLKALESFGHRTETNTTHAFRRGLFADDASRGLALIDLVRQQFDVVLMNPPFGQFSAPSLSYARIAYRREVNDILAAFVSRGAKLAPDGVVAAITARTAFFVGAFSDWRKHLLESRPPVLMADFGLGVLDALVETSAFVLDAPKFSAGVFINLLASPGKHQELQSAVANVRAGKSSGRISFVNSACFKALPAAEFAYWLPQKLLMRSGSSRRLGNTYCIVRQGLQSGDDFRFLRLAWEISVGTGRWELIAKGGEYSPYYDDVHLAVDWRGDGRSLSAYINPVTGLPRGNIWMLRTTIPKYFFQGGMTYPKRTTSGFGLKILSKGIAFSDQAMSVFPCEGGDLFVGAAILMSRFGQLFIEAQIGQGDAVSSGSAARRYTQAIIENIPVPHVPPDTADAFKRGVLQLSALARRLTLTDETTRLFCDCVLRPTRGTTFSACVSAFRREQDALALEMLRFHKNIDDEVIRLCDLTHSELAYLDDEIGPHPMAYGKQPQATLDSLLRMETEELIRYAVGQGCIKRFVTKKCYYADRKLEVLSHITGTNPFEIVAHRERIQACLPSDFKDAAESLLSVAIGVAFDRWTLEVLTGLLESILLPDVGEKLPVRSPAASSGTGVEILVDDNGHDCDLGARVEEALARVWGDKWYELRSDLEKALSVEQSDGHGYRTWIRTRFFEDHLRRYSKSRRQAPVYWPLATPSANYTVWLYAPRVSADTLFRVQKLVEEKLKHEQRQLAGLKQSAGENPTQSQRRETEAAETFVAELATMLDEVTRLAPLWDPNLDDGFVVVLAPLWRLFPQHRAWQNDLKDRWDELCTGEHDWAHIAMHLWPERVVPKCQTDPSLAIAHGLEGVFWEDTQPDTDAKAVADTDAETQSDENTDMYGDEEDTKPKKRAKRASSNQRWVPKPVDKNVIDQLIAERTKPAVKRALKSLLEAPTPGGKNTTRKPTTKAPKRSKKVEAEGLF